MKKFSTLSFAALVILSVPLCAQESQPTESRDQQGDRGNAQQGDSWTTALKDRDKRGTLHDAFQNVRGDSGKWNDEPLLQHAPPIGQKPAKMPLDDWADQLLERDSQLTSNDDNWLLLRTRQLDDNDRVWLERIERRGNRFTIVVSEAIWQGRYSKTFTYYSALGVNLGKLAPGKYEAKWIIKPLVFKQFEGDGRPTDNWPKDERPAENKPTELRVTFSIAAVLAVSSHRAAAQTPADKVPDNATAEWPQFLGPQRSGLSSEAGLLDHWPEDGPKVVWRAPGGAGMSGLAVSRGRVLTLVQREGEQWLISLNANTGESVWQTEVAPEYRNAMGHGPRATPTISGDRVFVFTGDGILAAIDFRDGKRVWSHNVVAELSGKVAEYGMACSPLVIGEQVIVTAGAANGTLVAYDTESGKQLWTAGNDPAGYSSPALLNVGGRPQIVAVTGSSALGVVPATGVVLWRYPFETNYHCNIATPLEIKGRVFLSSGENHGSVLLALKPQADQFEISEVWDSFGPRSVLRNEWQTSMLLDGHLYGMDNVGGAGPVTHLTCVNAATGERLWQVPRFGKGNLIAADGKLFITTIKGELVVARAIPERYDEIGRMTVLGSTRQAPALSQGRLYLRDDNDVVCIDARQP